MYLVTIIMKNKIEKSPSKYIKNILNKNVYLETHHDDDHHESQDYPDSYYDYADPYDVELWILRKSFWSVIILFVIKPNLEW